jgi:hypothetical protein
MKLICFIQFVHTAANALRCGMFALWHCEALSKFWILEHFRFGIRDAQAGVVIPFAS